MEVKFHKNFKKKFNKLPVKLQEQFYERLELFFQNKFDKILNNHSVDKVFSNCSSINVSGDYRAIFDLDKDGNIVILLILRIKHRKEVYL